MESYEKKYKDALGWMQSVYQTMTGADKEDAEHFFPELKESEDERIRKMLIKFFGKGAENNSSTNGISDKDIVAWLEKRGEQILANSAKTCKEEQKPADKVESKFHKGDWIISNDKKSIYQVIEVKRGIYVIRDNADNHEYHIGIEECEKSGRLFTIHYAKDGDVLASGQDIFIFKEIRGAWIYCYCLGDNDGLFMANSYDLMRYNYYDIIHPATKEQRDTLMKAMVDAGYTFDFDKKILNKIEQKPAWSEEDEAHIDSLLKRLEGINKPGAAFISTIFAISEDEDWLKSLKDRVGCEANCTTTWKPSDEQIEALEHFVRSIGESGYASPYENNTKLLYSLLEQLKKL